MSKILIVDDDADGREMVALVPTIVWDAKEIQRLDSTYESYRSISAKTLLLNDIKSPAYLRNILPTLANINSHTRSIELEGLNHNTPDRDAPEQVAVALEQFFSE